MTWGWVEEQASASGLHHQHSRQCWESVTRAVTRRIPRCSPMQQLLFRELAANAPTAAAEGGHTHRSTSRPGHIILAHTLGTQTAAHTRSKLQHTLDTETAAHTVQHTLQHTHLQVVLNHPQPEVCSRA